MHTDSKLSRLIHRFSPRAWLAIAVVSFVMALGSGLVLWSQLGRRQTVQLTRAVDAVELFLRDTARLTFHADRFGSQLDQAIFVAPRGILDSEKDFIWVVNYVDLAPRPDDARPAPAAPLRLLDPDWKPNFAGV